MKNNFPYLLYKYNSVCDSNSGLGYTLAFYKCRYNITISDDFELCIARISLYHQ